jgi:hypothetical protein
MIRDIPMIKNLVVNLSTGKDEDGAQDYAISLARELDAHLAAVAFACEPIPAATLCWDGSRGAARAIGDAMPLLERANAAGSAALIEPGTELCRRENVEHLLASVEVHAI